MDQHDLKTRLQHHLTDGLVVVVGSGLSCAEGLPGMGELAKHLCEHIEPELKGKDVVLWSKILPAIQALGLEAALLSVTPSPEIELLIVKLTAQFIAQRERGVITQIFQGARELRMTRLLRHLLHPSSGLPIITTNYDRLIEIAVEEAACGVDTMFVGHFCGSLNERESHLSFCREVKLNKGKVKYIYRRRALIFKPHGSLDWYLRNSKPVFYAGDLPEATRLIITPGINKFRTGYESPFDHHRDRANQAIDKASRYLVIGYGFNDDHLETHLSPAIRGGKPTLMMTHTLSPKARNLALSHANVIAIEKTETGTRVIIDQTTMEVGSVQWWDLNHFVTDILEP